MAAERAFWVFGYGSLMWNPGFEALERRRAVLDGYTRRFALHSIRHRGRPGAPGLVLGLDWDPETLCVGFAYRVCPTHERAVRAYLHHREMGTRSYIEICTPVRLVDEAGRTEARVEALAYVLDRTHVQYAGRLAVAEQARIIACATGPSGPNREYLHNTVAHLREVGIDDPELAAVDALVRGWEAG